MAHARRVLWMFALCLALGPAKSSNAQLPQLPPQAQLPRLPHNSGQTVAPVFEGWQQNPDGSFDMFFGYMNRNYQEEPEIPVGPNNNIEPGGPDRGQPSHFYPRRQKFVFKVTVPKDWGKQDLVWTLTVRGRTEKAYGSLWPDWVIDNDAIGSNRSSGLKSVPENQPPSIKLESQSQRTITLGNTVTLTAFISDDGLPKPKPREGAPTKPSAAAARSAAQFANAPSPRSQAIVRPPTDGVGVTWVHYRGPGKVTFSEMRPKITDSKAVTTASFSEPGTYVLRAYADDGILTTPADVVVTVRSGATSQAER